MPVSYIVSQFQSKSGITDRNVAVRFLNEAVREWYTQYDPPGSLMEQVFKVNGDQTITLPSYVGKLRAVREYASMQTWHINQMRPRYNQFNWPDMWRNWRIKNHQALQTSVTNESFGIVGVSAIENPPVIVSISGPSKNATLIAEDIILDSTSTFSVPPGSSILLPIYWKQTVNIYTDYTSVKKSAVNQNDITLYDVDGKVLTVIPNNVKEAKYLVVDISSCPWLPQNTSVLDNYVEILYKRSLPYLYNDDDEVPAFDSDDIIVNKMMQLWAEEQNKVDIATAYDGKAARTSARVNEDQTRATEDTVAFVANPHDTMLKRIGTGLRRRYSLYAGRKY